VYISRSNTPHRRQLTIAMERRGIEDYLSTLRNGDRGDLAQLIASGQSCVLPCDLKDAGNLKPTKSVRVQTGNKQVQLRTGGNRRSDSYKTLENFSITKYMMFISRLTPWNGSASAYPRKPARRLSLVLHELP
jgi:hypothetical protein